MANISRRYFNAGVAGALFATVWPLASMAGEASPTIALSRLERERRVRLGVAALDTGTGKSYGLRQHERFPMCSTHKLLTAAAILAQADAGKLDLQHHVAYVQSDLKPHSPVTELHLADGLSVGELCRAMLTTSDNTAANLLLANFLGGPLGWTAYARSIGDNTTRLDRIETNLNEAVPGDPRDTTTPMAMLSNLHVILLGNALLPTSRRQLIEWLLANTTGDARLKAGLPEDWRIGDKTGSGGHGTTNDIAILWPPRRPPLLVAVYQTESMATSDEQDAVIAAVGRIVAAST